MPSIVLDTNCLIMAISSKERYHMSGSRFCKGIIPCA